MTPLDETNAAHADALKRADGNREVALSILARQLVDARASLRRIAQEDFRGNPPPSCGAARRALAESYGVSEVDLDRELFPIRY
jgi:hypothetical protein